MPSKIRPSTASGSSVTTRQPMASGSFPAPAMLPYQAMVPHNPVFQILMSEYDYFTKKKILDGFLERAEMWGIAIRKVYRNGMWCSGISATFRMKRH